MKEMIATDQDEPNVSAGPGCVCPGDSGESADDMIACENCCPSSGQRCPVKTALRHTLRTLSESRSELKTEQDRLCKLAVTTFSLLGEARLTAEGLKLNFFGDVAPQTKMKVDPDGDFTEMAGVMKLMHPDDIAPYRRAIEEAITTGEPFNFTYRLADGKGGWRWLKARACSLGVIEGGMHVHWIHDTVEITDLKTTEEALKQSVDELRRLKTRLQRENKILKDDAVWTGSEVQIIGRSEPLMRVLRQIDLVAATSATVLIEGETGSGKEMIARAIHRQSSRKNRLFVTINCAALPAALVESELFGHVKGAFTGANTRRAGRFEQAEGGTLFLDEVGELPPETQAKMLRVLQSGEYEQVGSDRTLRTDVRVIAATNRNLERAIQNGRFRSDLYHRLAVFPILLPSLRERREDIPLLASYLVTQRCRKLGRRIDSIPNAIIDRLCAYEWPGNVRELENVIERAIILSPGTSLQPDSIQLGAISPAKQRDTKTHHAADGGEIETLRTREREHILHVCRKTSWKIKGPDGAATLLGLNPGTLYARMKKLGICRQTKNGCGNCPAPP